MRGYRLFSLHSSLLILAVLCVSAPSRSAADTSIRFLGSGVIRPGFDRIIIPIDEPETPADIGSGDFTIEFWIKGTQANNPTTGTVSCNQSVYNWFYGATIFDRDRLDTGLVPDGSDFGVSLIPTGLAFGLNRGQQYTLCSSGGSLLDEQWHHIALQRSLNGRMEIYVDGSLRGTHNGPSGDISFPNGAATSGRVAERSIFLGAEKHDFGPDFPSYNGLIDELRLSSVIRYTSTFTPQRTPFVVDSTTLALYHFDGAAGPCSGPVVDSVGQSPGNCAFEAGPLYVTDSPFTQGIADPNLQIRVRRRGQSLIIQGSTLSNGEIQIFAGPRVIRRFVPDNPFRIRLRVGTRVRALTFTQSGTQEYQSAVLRRKVR